MNWVDKNGRKYAYKARWVDGRCVKEYVGTGRRAEEAVRRDCEARVQSRAELQKELSQWSRIEAARRPLDAFCDRTKALTHAVLVLTGCYLHKGHEWRRRDANV